MIRCDQLSFEIAKRVCTGRVVQRKYTPPRHEGAGPNAHTPTPTPHHFPRAGSPGELCSELLSRTTSLPSAMRARIACLPTLLRSALRVTPRALSDVQSVNKRKGRWINEGRALLDVDQSDVCGCEGVSVDALARGDEERTLDAPADLLRQSLRLRPVPVPDDSRGRCTSSLE